MTIFNTLNELNGKSGGLLGCGIMIAAGLLVWAAVLAVRGLKRANNRLKEKIRMRREKRAVDRMTNLELTATAVHGERKKAYLALERLEDAASLLEIAQCTDKNTAKRAATKYCTLYGHDWEDCKCRICGKVRDEEHDWEGCTCRICGKKQDAGHDWDGCKCRICGKVRDEEHDWNGVVCRKCGAVKPHEHVWAFAYEDYSCGNCDKPKAGGVEDWCGDFCFGPGTCSSVRRIDIERCNLCGEYRERP